MSDVIFEAAGLTKEFGEVTALRDVSLAFRGPSIIGLVGRNASGKTTLLRHMVGLQLPTRGQARTFDVEVDVAPLNLQGLFPILVDHGRH